MELHYGSFTLLFNVGVGVGVEAGSGSFSLERCGFRRGWRLNSTSFSLFNPYWCRMPLRYLHGTGNLQGAFLLQPFLASSRFSRGIIRRMQIEMGW